MNANPPQELLDKMVEYARTATLNKLKKHKEVTERVKQSVSARFVASDEELVAVLASDTSDPCVPLIRRDGRDFSVWLWLPGLDKFDIVSYRFDGNGTYRNAGSMLHSKMILGR